MNDCIEINPASEVCQRWRHQRHTWRHARDGGFDADRYRVEPISEPTAKAYVVTHHYSRTYPAAAHRHGLFEGGELLGVAVFGIPVQTAALTKAFPGLEPMVESYELSRFVLADEVPANAESWFLARCFDQLAARHVRGVLSFADPVPRTVAGETLFAGHVGTIYQASNAVHAGRGTPRTLTLLPDGTVLNDRSVQKVRSQDRGHEHVEAKLIGYGARPIRAGENPSTWLRSALEDIHVTRLRHRGCIRYLFPIGTPAQRRRVQLGFKHRPYIKEVDS